MTNNTPELEAVKAKIAKLLALAENNTNTNEAAVAAGKAAALIQEYNLSLDAVRDRQAAPDIAHITVMNHYLHVWRKIKPNTEDPEPAMGTEAWFQWMRRQARQARSRGNRSFPEDGMTDWYTSLAYEVARTCGCDCSIFGPISSTFVGPKGKVEMAAFLMSNIYSRIQRMADAAVEEYAADYKREHGQSAWREAGSRHPKLFRKGFVEGAGNAIALKLLEMYDGPDTLKNYHRNGEAGAYLSVRVVENAIQLYKEQRWPNIKPMESEKISRINAANRGSHAGQRAGYEAGQSFELQQGLKTAEKAAVKTLPGGKK